MDIRFLCPDCGQVYHAPHAKSGGKFACHRCGWPLAVPGRGMSPAVAGGQEPGRIAARDRADQIAA